MLMTHIVKYALFCSFKGGAKRFSHIVMHSTSNKFVHAMFYTRMVSILLSNFMIGTVLISYKMCIPLNKLINQRKKLI